MPGTLFSAQTQCGCKSMQMGTEVGEHMQYTNCDTGSAKEKKKIKDLQMRTV